MISIVYIHQHNDVLIDLRHPVHKSTTKYSLVHDHHWSDIMQLVDFLIIRMNPVVYYYPHYRSSLITDHLAYLDHRSKYSLEC